MFLRPPARTDEASVGGGFCGVGIYTQTHVHAHKPPASPGEAEAGSVLVDKQQQHDSQEAELPKEKHSLNLCAISGPRADSQQEATNT